MCAGCRRRRPKAELVRLALSPSGAVILDPPSRAPGRGAYLCRESGPACLEKARRRGGLGRSLRVGENVIDAQALRAQLNALAKEAPSFPAR
jgi:predicted RNA-binding protein YlxR (DUF448 family)